MKDKWNIKKKGYLKIHIAVNVKSKKILSMRVTDEHVHDIKVLLELIDDIIKSDNVITIGKLLVLMALMILQYIQIFGRKEGVLPCIKVRKRMLSSSIEKRTYSKKPISYISKK